MGYRQYTDCVKPSNFINLGFTYLAVMGLIATITTGIIVAAASGPAATVAIAVLIALVTVLISFLYWWLYGRLICLGEEACLIGKVLGKPSVKPLTKAGDDDASINVLLPQGPPRLGELPLTLYSEAEPQGNLGVSNPEALCFGRVPTIVGTSGDDFIEGTPGRDVIAGLEGNDTIQGNGGRDVVCGNEGNDVIEEVERARGGDGDDTLTAKLTMWADLWGGDGNDTLSGGLGPDDLFGGPGDDVMQGHEGHDRLQDSEGTNEFDGGTRSDRILPGRGSAEIVGGAGRDTLSYGDRSNIRGVAIDLATGTVLVEGSVSQTVDGVEIVIGSRAPTRSWGAMATIISRGGVAVTSSLGRWEMTSFSGVSLAGTSFRDPRATTTSKAQGPAIISRVVPVMMRSSGRLETSTSTEELASTD